MLNVKITKLKRKSSSIHLHFCVQNVNFPGYTFSGLYQPTPGETEYQCRAHLDVTLHIAFAWILITELDPFLVKEAKGKAEMWKPNFGRMEDGDGKKCSKIKTIHLYVHTM